MLENGMRVPLDVNMDQYDGSYRPKPKHDRDASNVPVILSPQPRRDLKVSTYVHTYRHT